MNTEHEQPGEPIIETPAEPTPTPASTTARLKQTAPAGPAKRASKRRTADKPIGPEPTDRPDDDPPYDLGYQSGGRVWPD